MLKFFSDKLKGLNNSQKIHLGIYGVYSILDFFLMAGSTSWFTKVSWDFPFVVSIVMVVLILIGIILTIR